VQVNYLYNLFIFFIVDPNSLYQTHFDFLLFLIVYLYWSIVYASKEVIVEYIRSVIESQISLSSSLTLRKDEVFQRRTCKVDTFINYLIVSSICTIAFLSWLFYYSNVTLVLLLAYPAFINLLELAQLKVNFKFQIHLALSNVVESKIVSKIYFTFLSQFLKNVIEFIINVILFTYHGFSL